MFIKLVKFMGEIAIQAGKAVSIVCNKVANVVLTKLKKKEKEVKELMPTEEKDIKEKADRIAEAIGIFTVVDIIWHMLQIDIILKVLIISLIADIILIIYRAVNHVKPNLV